MRTHTQEGRGLSIPPAVWRHESIIQNTPDVELSGFVLAWSHTDCWVCEISECTRDVAFVLLVSHHRCYYLALD